MVLNLLEPVGKSSSPELLKSLVTMEPSQHLQQHSLGTFKQIILNEHRVLTYERWETSLVICKTLGFEAKAKIWPQRIRIQFLGLPQTSCGSLEPCLYRKSMSHSLHTFFFLFFKKPEAPLGWVYFITRLSNALQSKVEMGCSRTLWSYIY